MLDPSFWTHVLHAAEASFRQNKVCCKAQQIPTDAIFGMFFDHRYEGTRRGTGEEGTGHFPSNSTIQKSESLWPHQVTQPTVQVAFFVTVP